MNEQGEILSGDYLRAELEKAGNLTALLAKFTGICRAMGFKHALYASSSIRDDPGNDPLLLTSFPQIWVDHYLNSDYQDIDPALLLAVTSILPINWSSISRRSARIRKFFAEAEKMGVGRTGITVSVFGPRGRSGLFSATSDMDAKSWAKQSARLERDVTYISHHVHERVMALTSIENEPAKQQLSLMEKSCLQWIADGLTMREVALKLGVTERTVRMYLTSVRTKLNARNTIHAVSIMMRQNRLN